MPVKSFYLLVKPEGNQTPEFFFTNEIFNMLLATGNNSIIPLLNDCYCDEGKFFFKESKTLEEFINFLENIQDNFNHSNIPLDIYFSRKFLGNIYKV